MVHIAQLSIAQSLQLAKGLPLQSVPLVVHFVLQRASVTIANMFVTLLVLKFNGWLNHSAALSKAASSSALPL